MRKGLRTIWIWFVMALLISPCLPVEVWGEAEDLIVPEDEPSPYHLRADYFSYDERQGIYTARGRVSLRSQDQVITADEIRLDGLTRQAILEGNVRVEQGNDWLESERAFLDLKKQTGTIEQGRGFLAENHFHFSGALIEKLGAQTYHLEKARFTTCEGENPSWHFRTSDLRITVDGYAFAKHSRFHLGPVPVLYTPYLAFPAKRTRQSGLLPPLFGNSDRLGAYFDLPFYWAISESTDATFYANYLSKRGLMPGAEFRYAASEKGKGVLRFDYIDDQEDSQTILEQNLRLEDEPGLIDVSQERWWWRSKQDYSLPHGAYGKLDLDLASDPTYLRVFDVGYNSWDESNDIFRANFGRGLINDPSVTTRESSLLLTKSWAAHTLNGNLHYFQNLNTAEDENQLQQLPLIDYSATRQPLLGGPLFWEANGVLVNYWREEGTRGQRLNLFPQVSLPLSVGRYLEVEPSVGFLETLYLVNDFDEPEDSTVRESTLQTRELFDARLEVSTEISRIFQRSDSSWSKIKHTIRPEVVYQYIPKVSQDELPFFDSTDRISNRNRITYSLTNFLVARLDREPGKVAYNDFARLKFSQSYNLEEPEIELETGIGSGRPFSNLLTQLDVTPGNYLELTYKNEWSPYDGDFKRNDLLLRLWDRRGDSIRIDYREQRDDDGRTLLNEIDGRLSVNLWGGVSLGYRNNYSFERNQNLENDYIVQINRQCWGISIVFRDNPDERWFMVGFNLLGVGGLTPQAVPVGFF
jgi:LPS-assembly protein